jgi:hypothetical protein
MLACCTTPDGKRCSAGPCVIAKWSLADELGRRAMFTASASLTDSSGSGLFKHTWIMSLIAVDAMNGFSFSEAYVYTWPVSLATMSKICEPVRVVNSNACVNVKDRWIKSHQIISKLNYIQRYITFNFNA